MAGTFDFCPDGLVPETMPPEPGVTVALNGWTFSSKPVVPYQRKFRVTLHGLQWFLAPNGLYDNATNPTVNARRLEEFYELNGTWDHFEFMHPHIGVLTVRFASPVTIPAGIPNSGGLVSALEVNLLHHNPGY